METQGQNLQSLLRHAAARGDKETVRDLLEQGAVIDSLDNAPLRWAFRHGHTEVAQLLLDHGAPVSEYEDELFHHAIARRSEDSVRLLLKKLPVRDPLQEVELLTAGVKSGDARIVELLLNEFNHPYIRDSELLVTAAAHGNAGMIELFAQHGCDSQAHYAEALYAAVFSQSIEAVICVLGLNVGPKTEVSPALYHAIVHGDAEMAEVLIRAGVPLSPDSVVQSASNDALEVLLLLLDNGIDLQTYADDIVAKCCQAPAPRILEYVLGHAKLSSTILDQGLEPAVRKASELVVKLLLDAGANPSTNQSAALALPACPRRPVAGSWT